MKKFTVAITETLCKTVDIIADSFDDAYEQAHEQYNTGMIELDSMNFVDSDIEVLGFEAKSPYLIRVCEPDTLCRNIIMFDSEENINSFIETLNAAPIEVLIVPEDILIYGKICRLTDYERAYNFEPIWVSEHQYLWM